MGIKQEKQKRNVGLGFSSHAFQGHFPFTVGERERALTIHWCNRGLLRGNGTAAGIVCFKGDISQGWTGVLRRDQGMAT